MHSQDIAVPLGRPLPLAPAAGAADRVWRSGCPFRARKGLAGFRLAATDTPWSVGEGRD